MQWKRKMSFGLALLLGGAVAAQAQTNAPPAPAKVQDAKPMPGAPTASTPVVEAAPAPEEEPPWGPTNPEDVKFLMGLGFGGLLEDTGSRLYGWFDSGYTYSSNGPGLLATEPRENRFGNEYLVNQIALVLDKPLKSDEFSLGYNATFYAGADAALLRPRGGFDTTDPRFGVDFRQLYVSAHLPILTEGGMDVKVGRMGTIIGYESALAPYRPFYSNDYQWFYSEDGAWTGALTNLHVNKQLDILNGITMGANTFFTLRGNGPCYIGQINYWLTEEKKTLLSASLHLGNQAIFAAPGLAGDFDTVVEFRVQHEISKYLSVIMQSDDGWDHKVPGIGTGSWWSFYTIAIAHLTPTLDLNLRGEWFYDVQGTRIGVKGNFEEATVGFDYHPTKCVSFRPEIRFDNADNPAFGPQADKSNQLLAAFDVLFKF